MSKRQAIGAVYKPRLTDVIHDEWIRNALANHPNLTLARLARTRFLMNSIDPAMLVTDYESLIFALTLPDPDDRHVLAAAIHSGATAIVTFNLKDFPDSALAPHGIEALHPDTFVTTLMTDPAKRAQIVVRARQGRQSLMNPPKTVSQYLETLRRQGLSETADWLNEYEGEL